MDKWTDKTNKRTDTRNQIWCVLALNVKSGGNNLNDFSDNQLTKYSVFVGWSRIFIPLPLNCYEALRFVSPWDGRSWQTQWTNKRLCLFVRLCLRWSLTLTAWKHCDCVSVVGWVVHLCGELSLSQFIYCLCDYAVVWACLRWAMFAQFVLRCWQHCSASIQSWDVCHFEGQRRSHCNVKNALDCRILLIQYQNFS